MSITRLATFVDLGITRFHLCSNARGPVIVEKIVRGDGAAMEDPFFVTLPSMKPLFSLAEVVTRDPKISHAPLSGLMIPAVDLLAFMTHLSWCYPRNARLDVPAFYQITNELRWLEPPMLTLTTWQPYLSLQQKWEHIFGFEPDVWLPLPVMPPDTKGGSS